MFNKSLIKIDKEKLSQLFRSERQKLGLSKQEVIKLCQGRIGKTTLVSIEYGKKDCYREDIFVELARFFNINFEVFLDRIRIDIHELKDSSLDQQSYHNAEKGLKDFFNYPYSIATPNQNDIRWIEMVEKRIYSESIANSYDNFKSWLIKNPKCVTILKDRSNKICGYFAPLPVKNYNFERFVTGELFDTEIKSADIFSLKEKSKVKYLYNESFLVMDENFNFNIMGIYEYMKYLPQIFGAICNVDNDVTLFSIIGKEGDEVILNEMGFSKIVVSPESRTKYDVYYIEIKYLLNRVEQKFEFEKQTQRDTPLK